MMSLSSRPAPSLRASAARPALRRAALLRVRAEKQTEKKPEVPSTAPGSGQPRLDQVLEELKKTGMTTAKAKEVLKKWKEAGVDDAQSLRRMLVKRSLKPLTGLGIQATLDAVAAWGGFYLADLTTKAPDMPFGIFVQLLGYFFGLYYGTQVVFELTVIATVLYSTYKYGTSSTELLVAVQQLAGPGTGLSVVDQAQRAVNTIKVLAALDALSEALKDTYGPEQAAAGSTLRNLSAMMTLKHAKEAYGFVPEDYGLTEKQAGNIALAFATYDLNDNGKLDLFELGRLCQDLGRPLEGDELKEAMRVLDTNQNKVLEFNEFVSWWQGRVGKAPSGVAEIK